MKSYKFKSRNFENDYSLLWGKIKQKEILKISNAVGIATKDIPEYFGGCKMDNLKVLGKEKIGSIEFTGIEGGFGKDKKCMLAKDIANIHGQQLKKINQLINNNKKRFKDGIDLINLLSTSQVLRNFAEENGLITNNRVKYIYLLSERGYLKLVKLLEDEKAWEIYEELVDNYFNMRSAVKDDDKVILRHKRLEIMEENSKTRQAQLMYKVAMETKSETMKQKLLNKIAERMTGEEFHNHVPSKQDYSATWIANQLIFIC